MEERREAAVLSPHDPPEQIEKCLCCPREKCTNCVYEEKSYVRINQKRCRQRKRQRQQATA